MGTDGLSGKPGEMLGATCREIAILLVASCFWASEPCLRCYFKTSTLKKRHIGTTVILLRDCYRYCM